MKGVNMLGPIDYIAVSFKGNNFDGSILEALSDAADSGAIRVVDLAFIIKDSKGNIAIGEIEDQHDELKEVAKLLGHKGDLPLFTESDAEKIGDLMSNDTSAGILVIEQLWAKGLKKALLDANAELIDEGRIHPDKVAEAVEDIKASKTKAKVKVKA
jgi:hypothetical protein